MSNSFKIKRQQDDIYSLLDEYDQVVATAYGPSSLIVMTAAAESMSNERWWDGWVGKAIKYTIE